MADMQSDDMEAEFADLTMITILAKGNTVDYVVPSFPVFSTRLTEVKLQWENCEGELEVFDGFAHDCEALNHTLPAALKIPYGFQHAFIIEGSEFSRSIDIDGYNLFGGSQVFVIWNWNWIEEDSSTATSDNLSASNSPPPSCSNSPPLSSDSNASSQSDDNSIPAITHTVVFKCIGAHKEKRYQEILAIASRKLENGIKVPVTLLPEPKNKYDNKAIAFMCQINDSDWERIGYVVSEALEEVHEAVYNRKILDVSFDWIKYIVHFKSPGWYAGIRITRNGEWSQKVLRSRASSFCHQ